MRWVVLIAVAVRSWCPSRSRSSADSGPRALRNDPAGLPDPWIFEHYTGDPDRRRVLAPALQQRRHRGHHGRRGGVRVRAGRIRVRALRVPRPGGPLHPVRARPAVPGGRRDPAAVHPAAHHGPARQPARRGPATGGLRHPADDHHPAARSSRASRPSSRTPPPSTAAAASGSSGASCCRCPDRRSPR